MRIADWVRAAVTKRLWSSERVEREAARQLKLALREQTDNERAMQPEHQTVLLSGWKRSRLEQVQELAVERNVFRMRINGKPTLKEELSRNLLTGVRETGSDEFEKNQYSVSSRKKPRTNSRR